MIEQVGTRYERKATPEPTPETPKKNLEEEFGLMVANYVPRNFPVKDLRETLGRFNFETNKSLDGLIYVSEEVNEKGEIYYGFM